MKICFIGWGNSVHVQRWVTWFARRGHEVHLISNCDEQIEGVIVHPLQNRSAAESEGGGGDKKAGFVAEWIKRAKFAYLSYLRYPAYIKQVKRLLAEIKPDILQGFYLGFAGYLGAGSGFHPLMIFTGGADLLHFPQKYLLHRLWTKYALSKIDLLVHPSLDSHEAALKLEMAAERSKVLHFGIDLQQFNPAGTKADLGVGPLILSTRGLFDKYYNISGLLRVFAIVEKEIPAARLVLKYYSAPEKDKFIRLATELGIYDKIIWIGKGKYSDMPAYYRAADVYVSLSFTDSGPVSLLEAMACGCVPVVSNLKNLHEWVRDGWNGYLVEPNDVEGAAGRIFSLLQDKERRKVFAERGVALIKEKADQEKCFGELEKLSLELVAAAKKEAWIR